LASDPLTFQQLGGYNGPRSILEDFPTPFVYRQMEDSAAVTVSAFNNDKVEGNIWGFRLGPYLEYPFGSNLTVQVMGGVALALVDARWSWSQSIAVNGVTLPTQTGRADGTDALWGWYVGGTIAWRFSERWSTVGGVQFQDVGAYRSSKSGREFQLDLSNTLFATLGLSYSF
jgi:opacity protein-like surface antigen